MLDVITTIQTQMMSDDTNDSDRLIRTYEGADEATKAVIDDVLITLCGYSMPSLLEMSSEMEDEGAYQ